MEAAVPVQVLSILDIVSLVASLLSLILGLFAIWLSFQFYKMSESSSKETQEASKSIQSGVDRLDKLFNSLYADTFGMMKDTVSDMRKHLWARNSDDDEESMRKAVDVQLDQVRKELHQEINVVLSRLDNTDKKAREQVEELIEKAISRTRTTEDTVRSEMQQDQTIKAEIHSLLFRQNDQSLTFMKLREASPSLRRLTNRRLERILTEMEKDQLVSIKGTFGPNMLIVGEVPF